MMMISMIFSSLSLNTCLTPGSIEPRRASAGEGSHSIHAGCTIQTQIRFTVVYVHLAQSASVSIHTFTPDRKCETKSVIYHMSVVDCIINMHEQLPQRFPHEPEIIDSIHTCTSIQTGGAVAFINVNLTMVSSEAMRTCADIPTLQVFTNTSILARAGSTLIYFQLTTWT